MQKKTKTYNNDTMRILKGADKVRLKPSVIFGSDDINGAKHTVFEILSNSIDEAKEGYGDNIVVTKHIDGSISIKDEGRGLPMDWNNVEQRYNYEIALCELYGGGKYDETYENSLGTNGLGLASTQMVSEYMDVISIRDGYKYSIHCEKGYPVTELKKEPTKETKTGTYIRYKPDIEVFTDIDIPIDWIKEILKYQAIVTKKVNFVFVDEKTNEIVEFCYEEGISQFLKEEIKNPLNDVVFFSGKDRGRDTKERPEYNFSYEFAFCFTANENTQLVFHNNGCLIHGGSTLNATKSALLYCIDKYLKDNNKYQKNEKKINIDDVLEGLSFVCNTYSNMTSYANQTKTAINNSFIQESLTKNLKNHITAYFIENPIDAQKITTQVLVNMRSRTNAEKTRLNTKKQLSEKMINNITNKIKKFVDCRSKDKTKRELYIVEGDSAAGSCKLGRNPEYQAIMPVRGKILNCLKASESDIFKSEIIIDLMKIIGCGVSLKSKYNKDLPDFDITKLNFDKIIICTDADVDGYQIRTLILTMIYKLCPELIYAGKVFIVETPLFEITVDKETYFAFNESEKNEIMKTKVKRNSKVVVQRSKGLGENTPDMMWETTMNPITRHLICVKEITIQVMEEVFNLLLGNNLKERKEYINTHGYEYVDVVD